MFFIPTLSYLLLRIKVFRIWNLDNHITIFLLCVCVCVCVLCFTKLKTGYGKWTEEVPFKTILVSDNFQLVHVGFVDLYGNNKNYLHTTNFVQLIAPLSLYLDTYHPALCSGICPHWPNSKKLGRVCVLVTCSVADSYDWCPLHVRVNKEYFFSCLGLIPGFDYDVV